MASAKSPTKKVLFLVGGGLLLLAGLALMVLPGPGIPLVIAGLALLGHVVPAVQRLEEKLRAKAKKLFGREDREKPVLS